MKIKFLPIYNNKYSQNATPGVAYPNLAPLKRDTVSFGAMKKSQFYALNRVLVEKFKAPIEKFNTEADFQNWAKKQAETLMGKNFGGRQAETIEQRKHMLKEWGDYVLKENGAYTGAMGLLILGAVTQNLKPDNDKLPPVLNKGILADCISEIDKNAKSDEKYQFNLSKMYETKLRAQYFETSDTQGGETGWVKIPSKDNDPEHFEENVEKLKVLSHKNWCTKSFNAEPYLEDGDFHVYLEDGKPKLGVRFVGNAIQEIQGELNNGKIPLSYLEEMQKHISENNLQLTQNATEEIEKAEQVNKEVRKIKNDLKDAIEKNNVKTIFKYFNIKVKEDKNGYLTISRYDEPSESFTFKDCGVDENILLEKVKCIKGYASFTSSQVTNLSNLKSIGGDAFFRNCQAKNLSNLESIGGHADFTDSQVSNLDSLKSIGGDANFTNCQVTKLDNLKYIGDNAFISKSQEEHLGAVLRKLTLLYAW